MITDNLRYGLTAQTVLVYSDMVRCGFDWSLAMAHLKELYETNKELYENNKAIALESAE